MIQVSLNLGSLKIHSFLLTLVRFPVYYPIFISRVLNSSCITRNSPSLSKTSSILPRKLLVIFRRLVCISWLFVPKRFQLAVNIGVLESNVNRWNYLILVINVCNSCDECSLLQPIQLRNSLSTKKRHLLDGLLYVP